MKILFYIFFSSFAMHIAANANPIVPVKETKKYIGEKISVCGKVTGSKGPLSNSSKSTTITVSDPGFSSAINVVIRHEDRKNFSYRPEEYLYNKQVCVTGVVNEKNGVAEIVVRRQDEINIEETEGGTDIRPLDFDGFNRFMQDED